jgi:hypothetical protein
MSSSHTASWVYILLCECAYYGLVTFKHLTNKSNKSNFNLPYQIKLNPKARFDLFDLLRTLYLLHCLARLKRIPTTLPRAPQAHTYYTAKFKPRAHAYYTAKFDFARREII